MDTFFGFVTVVMTAIVALFSALALQALLLRGVFALMEPATADRRSAPPSIARGTRLVARLREGPLSTATDFLPLACRSSAVAKRQPHQE